ncbi:hypothetical protein M899_1449 [Bacteriovorax sp. BSW11_IV]|uniref:hypothetical protein n=1 Tax=Bacteriovorax sp. BSW11_IV TaxID=1353529 RepID=UPI00038A395A|nr:hypothetical protein [Bacteriovorax sp. BSW11_IV]EQC48339.1 hypothetical protein M899_1449 [Bacteriovorax sp. BSW11_IV]
MKKIIILLYFLNLNIFAAGGVGGGIVTETGGGGGKDSYVNDSCQFNQLTNQFECMKYDVVKQYRENGQRWDTLINDINKRDFIGVESFNLKYGPEFKKIAPSITGEYEYNNCVELQHGEDISDCLKSDVEPFLNLKIK